MASEAFKSKILRPVQTHVGAITPPGVRMFHFAFGACSCALRQCGNRGLLVVFFCSRRERLRGLLAEFVLDVDNVCSHGVVFFVG